MDLKRFLMEFGNRLVTEHGFDPGGPVPPEIREALRTDHSTETLILVAEWLNLHPEIHPIMKEMGVQWPMPK